jgi:hypothetical protein
VGFLLLAEAAWLAFSPIPPDFTCTDQMPGGVASHETFTSAQYEDSGNTWLSFNGTIMSTSGYFTAYAASSTELDVWDDNCSY